MGMAVGVTGFELGQTVSRIVEAVMQAHSLSEVHRTALAQRKNGLTSFAACGTNRGHT
jgi:hypothetical protein